MPVLVIAFGPLQAVPIMALAALMANGARVIVWWREIDWRATLAYAAVAAPAAAIGARTLLELPPRLIEGALGAFFILMIPTRRWLTNRDVRLGAYHLALAGAPIGFLTGMVVSTGPISTPLFLAYGLVKGAFIGTEAAGSLAVYVSKAAVFRGFGALPMEIAIQGVIVGASLMVGTYISKHFVLHLAPERFRQLIDLLMLASGATLLWAAWA